MSIVFYILVTGVSKIMKNKRNIASFGIDMILFGDSHLPLYSNYYSNFKNSHHTLKN